MNPHFFPSKDSLPIQLAPTQLALKSSRERRSPKEGAPGHNEHHGRSARSDYRNEKEKATKTGKDRIGNSKGVPPKECRAEKHLPKPNKEATGVDWGDKTRIESRCQLLWMNRRLWSFCGVWKSNFFRMWRQIEPTVRLYGTLAYWCISLISLRGIRT
jgi:hypothetical protein